MVVQLKSDHFGIEMVLPGVICSVCDPLNSHHFGTEIGLITRLKDLDVCAKIRPFWD